MRQHGLLRALTAPQRLSEIFREFRMSETSKVGQRNGLPVPGGKGLKTAKERARLVARRSVFERVSALYRPVIELIVPGNLAIGGRGTQHIERPVTHDCSHPGKRLRPVKPVVPCAVPDTDKRILQTVLRQLASSQYT